MNKKEIKLQASIIVCTHNGEKRIKNCLNSLLKQSYNRKEYEIIVVDDGSTDRTSSIVSEFPVRLYKHTKNRGLAAARNTGLKHARGKVYICFDDDCLADQNWLKEILEMYKKPVAGVGGYTKNSTSGIVDMFLANLGHGNPSPVPMKIPSGVIQRFYNYIENMYKRNPAAKNNIYKVSELWGENCSFPTHILKSVNGWDETQSGIEDTELCQRIKNTTDLPFIITRKAKILHDGTASFNDLIQKRFKRGLPILRYYNSYNKFPPIFPFPLMYIISSVILFSLFGLKSLLILIMLPQVLYGWWLVLYFKTHKPYYLHSLYN